MILEKIAERVAECASVEAVETDSELYRSMVITVRGIGAPPEVQTITADAGLSITSVEDVEGGETKITVKNIYRRGANGEAEVDGVDLLSAADVEMGDSHGPWTRHRSRASDPGA